MDSTDIDTTLYRIDPSKNMARFYTLTIQPNLFGGHSLMREWGRIGSGGQMRVELYDRSESAIDAQKRVAESKLKRGYRCANSPANKTLMYVSHSDTYLS